MKAESSFRGNNWNNSIDIYEGNLSERLFNECNMEEMRAHSALDYLYYYGWISERDKNSKFVSKYAFENLKIEGFYETFDIWLTLTEYRQTFI